MREKVRKSITKSWEISKKKKRIKKNRENVENWWMMWPLMWFNRSIITINTMYQLIEIYKFIRK